MSSRLWKYKIMSYCASDRYASKCSPLPKRRFRSHWGPIGPISMFSVGYCRAEEADHYRATTTVCPRQDVVRSARPGRQHRRPAYHGWPRCCVTPVVPVSTTPATDGQIFPDFGSCEDTGARIRQPSWLLQQFAVRDRWRPADETADCPECSSACRDRN